MSETDSKISRRTLARGASWAAPAIAVTAMAPNVSASVATTTTTLPPCVASIGSTGGTYPVSVSLSNCSTASSHWDFIFNITAATQTGTNCDCPYLRITFFDNPKRTRLWISTNNAFPNPTTNTANSPRLYVQKVLAAGNTAAFPAQGDTVRVVTGGTGFITTPATDTVVGSILAPGQADDSLHTLMLPNGGLTCDATGPMAYYRVECGQSQSGPWTQLGDIGQINPCVPMIQSTVCRFDTTGNDRYRLGISVLTSCGIPASSFRITNIQRNSDTNFPNNGTSVWSGNQPLGPGTTNIDMTNTGSGTQLWISFTTDGVNTSRIRVPTNDTACVCALATPITTVCRVSGTNTTGLYRYTWTPVVGATSYDVRYSTSTTGDDNWVAVTNVTSPFTTPVQGVRRLQLRAVSGTCATWSAVTAVSGTTGLCPTGLTNGEQAVEQQDVTTESLDQQSVEQAPAVEQTPVVEEAPAVTPEPPSTETPVPTE